LAGVPSRKLSDVIRETREVRGLTQAQLAERAQVALSYVTLLEAGTQPGAPPRQILQRLARALGIRPEHLLKLEE
jgi:transcriptional regulator with XRE-family HTH domain